MEIFFTSDHHFGDNRFNLFYRKFNSLEEQEEVFIEKWNSRINKEDLVYYLGDFATSNLIDRNLGKKLNGRKILIRGNYDESADDVFLKSIFDEIYDNYELKLKNGEQVNLNHYPERCTDRKFNIVGHIHGLWRVQRNMLNVGVDAWNYEPVSEDEIIFAINAIKKHYNRNVFAGELKCNASDNEYNKLNLYYAQEDLPVNNKKSIFLAGPTHRDLINNKSWRTNFLDIFSLSTFNVEDYNIIIPEPRNIRYDVEKLDFSYDKQIEWEDAALKSANIILFWIPRDIEKLPGFTTNIEFGEWMKSGKCILGYPNNAPKMRYLEFKANKYNIPRYYSLMDIVNNLNKHI